MMRGRRGIVGLVILGVLGCDGAEEPPPSDGDASEPIPEPELFAPGVVSSELPEFAITFTPGGDTLLFNRATADRSEIRLMMSVRRDGGWATPEVYPPFDGVRAIDPFVSLDGRTLYVSADLPAPPHPEGSYNLWRAPLGADRTAASALPAPINTDSSEVFNSLSRDGLMVFSSRRSGQRAIFEVERGGDGWGTPRPVVFPDGGTGSNPAIHPDGTLLVFARAVGGRPSDLYVSCRETDGWGRPVRLPEPVNGPFTEFAPGFDARHLYFTSERPGMVGPQPDSVRPPGDVYRWPRDAVDAFCVS